MAKQPEVAANFPDILGALTRGPRFITAEVQCALTVRPLQVPAGQTFEVIVLLQSCVDVSLDVALKVELPARDLAKNKDPFTAVKDKLLVGLRPAEVGYVVLPVEAAPTVQPGSGYTVGVTLDTKIPGKQKPQVIRTPEGGVGFKTDIFTPETLAQLQALRQQPFAVEGKGKRIEAPFTVIPPTVAGLEIPQPNWISLWTMGDHPDEYVVAQQVWDAAQAALEGLKRDQVFMPLLKATQERFQASRYPLHPPEAIMITKILTLTLEQGATAPTEAQPRPPWPHWFGKLVRVLAREPALQGQPDVVAKRLLYSDLLYDAVVAGFASITNTTREEFGSPDEISAYATDLVQSLGQRQPIDVARVYLPLVMAGLIANNRVTMPREQVRDTVFTLSKALERRQSEKHADNGFVFEIVANLIEDALNMSSR